MASTKLRFTVLFLFPTRKIVTYPNEKYGTGTCTDHSIFQEERNMIHKASKAINLRERERDHPKLWPNEKKKRKEETEHHSLMWMN